MNRHPMTRLVGAPAQLRQLYDLNTDKIDKIGACPELPTAAILVTTNSTVTDSDQSARADASALGRD